MARRRKRIVSEQDAEVSCVIVPLSESDLIRLSQYRRSLGRGEVVIAFVTLFVAWVLACAIYYDTGTGREFWINAMIAFTAAASVYAWRDQRQRVKRFRSAIATGTKWIQKTRLTAVRLSGSIRNMKLYLTFEGLGEILIESCPPFEFEGFDLDHCKMPLPVIVELTQESGLMLSIKAAQATQPSSAETTGPPSTASGSQAR